MGPFQLGEYVVVDEATSNEARGWVAGLDVQNYPPGKISQHEIPENDYSVHKRKVKNGIPLGKWWVKVEDK